MSMTYGYSLNILAAEAAPSPRKEYKAVAYDEDGDAIYRVGDLNLRETRFYGANDARARISAALEKETSTVYPPVKIKVFEVVEELVAEANIYNETKMIRSLGMWSPV